MWTSCLPAQGKRRALARSRPALGGVRGRRGEPSAEPWQGPPRDPGLLPPSAGLAALAEPGGGAGRAAPAQSIGWRYVLPAAAPRRPASAGEFPPAGQPRPASAGGAMLRSVAIEACEVGY